jgi:hypothetical protein
MKMTFDNCGFADAAEEPSKVQNKLIDEEVVMVTKLNVPINPLTALKRAISQKAYTMLRAAD